MSLPHRIPASARVTVRARDWDTRRHTPTLVAREVIQPMEPKLHGDGRRIERMLLPAAVVAAGMLVTVMLWRTIYPTVSVFFAGVFS